MEYFQYAVLLKKDTSGGYVVTCRDLPQLITQGESIENALFEASDAMDEVFAAYMINNVKFPEPSPKKRGEYMVVPPAETIAKAALHTAMKEARVNKVQMAKRLGVDEKEVRRLLDPHYGSKLPRIAEAISLLGCRLVIGLELT
jgi:antitoxin HicB